MQQMDKDFLTSESKANLRKGDADSMKVTDLKALKEAA